jgi:hypothetical protein
MRIFGAQRVPRTLATESVLFIQGLEQGHLGGPCSAQG